MTLIRYAGYDPREDDFSQVDLAPLHEQDKREPGTHFNPTRLWALKHSGKSWSEIGRLLAHEEGRRVPYQGGSVRYAAEKGRML